MKKNAVILLSGGLDSQVLLAAHRQQYASVHAVCFDYGQRHRREVAHAQQIARYYGATFQAVMLPTWAKSPLTGSGDIPRDLHFEDPGQAATVVPGRNAVFLSVAAGIAQSIGATDVLFAGHAGDAAVYADCRGDFISWMAHAMKSAYGVRIRAPFLGTTKRGIVELGRANSVPMEDSWSCYVGGSAPCGECGACMERAEAMS